MGKFVLIYIRKFMVYNASLLKKSTRTFGETLLMTPQLLVNDVVNLI
jgi:hypothetical protein